MTNENQLEELLNAFDELDERKDVYGKVKTYSPEELLKRGREYANDSRYFEATVVFAEGKSRRIIRDISSLYLSVIFSIGSPDFIGEDNHEDDGQIIDKIIYCMIESTRMHAEKTLSDDDLSLLESLIDKVPYKTMRISNRTEFQRLYCRFKEYALKVFLGGK